MREFLRAVFRPALYVLADAWACLRSMMPAFVQPAFDTIEDIAQDLWPLLLFVCVCGALTMWAVAIVLSMGKE